MKETIKGHNHIIYMIIALNFILLYMFYDNLPGLIPIGMLLNPDHILYVDKIYIGLFPCLSLVVFGIIELFAIIHTEIGHDFIHSIQILSSIAILYITLFAIRIYSVNGIDAGKAIYIVIGITYIYIADLIGVDSKYKGISTPWTSKSMHVKTRTTLFSKCVFLSLGVINIFIIFLVNFNLISYYITTILLLLLIYFYSYLCYKEFEESR